MPTPAFDGQISAAVLPIVTGTNDRTALQAPRTSKGANPEIIYQVKSLKIPRPPNAFILYRQHHSSTSGCPKSVGSTQSANASSAKVSTATPATPETSEATVRPASRKKSKENAKLRPLNSFIAFRSFYSSVFPDLPQKVKSGLLRLLWGSDPFKAKWAIIAKAYSVIRDKHIGQVTLESFLTLIVPFIGIVSVTNYLNTMGLQVILGQDKQYSLVKTDLNTRIDPVDLTTNLSVDDVVQYCYQAGYVSGVHVNKTSGNQIAAMSMAVSAQLTPKMPVMDSMPTMKHAPLKAQPSHKTEAASNVTPNTDYLDKVETPQESPLSTSSVLASASVTSPLPMNAAIVPASQPGDARSTPYTAVDFEGDLRRAMNSFPYSSNDGYYDLFNTTGPAPSTVYNPYRFQGEFDGFDIGDFVDM